MLLWKVAMHLLAFVVRDPTEGLWPAACRVWASSNRGRHSGRWCVGDVRRADAEHGWCVATAQTTLPGFVRSFDKRAPRLARLQQSR